MSNAIQLTGFEPLCRLRSHLLETKITYLDSYIQYVAVSSNGRYVYIPSDKDIIIIDVIDGIESVCHYDTDPNLMNLKLFHALCLLTNETAYLITTDLDFGPRIQFVKFDYLTNNLDLSAPAPLNSKNYEYGSHFEHNGQLGILMAKRRDNNMYEDWCYIFEYANGAWITRLELLLGERQAGPFQIVYNRYPIIYDNHLYTFVSKRHYADLISGYLKEMGKICQINLAESKRCVIEVANDLFCLELHEQLLQLTCGAARMSKTWKWNGTNLFISWGFRLFFFDGRDSGGSWRNHMNYLFTFNLNTLLWRPIRIENLTPAVYELPLRVNVSDKNLICLVNIQEEERKGHSDYKAHVTVWQVPAPIEKPHSLRHLTQLAVLHKLRKLGSTTQKTEHVSRLLKQL